MHRRSFVYAVAVAAILGAAGAASAAPKDAAAEKKIDEAINTDYLNTDFDKAEGILSGTINACGDKCSPQVLAKAWMYIGVVRGSGKQDIGGATEAFKQAFALDLNVKLDENLATPAVKGAFEAARPGGAAAPAPTATTPTPAAGGGEVSGNMECTPEVTEVETRRTIPISCATDEPATKAELKYKEYGGDWQTAKMQKHGDFWQAEIPCTATQNQGKLRWYVTAKDSSGESVDSHGSKKAPAEITLVGESSQEPPTYPGREAPERCAESGSCPPGMEGTPACPGVGPKSHHGNKGWGAACESSSECEQGMLCQNGSCESAPSCESNADCTTGTCVNGTCDVGGEEGGGAPAGPYAKNWIGLAFAFDVAFIKGKNVCDTYTPSGDAKSFSCFYQDSNSPYTGTPHPAAGGTIGGGAAPATMRILASYERLFTPNIGGQLRAGFAFNGGPKPATGSFLPLHAELRGKYWFGSNVFSRKGARPFVFLGGGLAQVNSKLGVNVVECSSTNDDQPDPGCREAAEPPTNFPPPPRGDGASRVTPLNAYEKLGLGFVSFGGGLVYAFVPKHGIELNLNLMYMLPSSGLVIEPSLGYVFGL